MARVHLNILLEGASGRLGDQLVLKRSRGGQTILCQKPTFEHRVFSQAQLAHQERFREAAAYARSAAQREPIYAEKGKKAHQPAYNVALADFMHPPEILEMDLSGYTGRAGEAIRIRARDDVRVKRVNVVVVDAEGQVVEQGAASEGTMEWWRYTTTIDCPTAKVKVVARAEDLPGNKVEREEMKG